MKKSIQLLSLFALLSSFLVADHPAIELLDKFEAYNLETFEEKVFLHLDKPYYAQGETIWFKAYAAMGMTLEPDTLSVPLYVDLIDLENNELLAQKVIELNGGYGHGAIELLDSAKAGDYEIRAYTNWMKNFNPDFFFRQSIKILSFDQNDYQVADGFDFQLFPEGGDLVNGLSSKVAFKASDSFGNGVDVQGIVLNAGDTLVKFASMNLGMGYFNFTPFLGSDYKVLVKKTAGNYKEVPLPEVKESGIVVTVDNLSNAKLTRLYLSKTDDLGSDQVAIIAQSRGVVYYTGLINFSDKMAVVPIPKADFPKGVAQITLIDGKGKPQCERLVFMKHDEVTEVAIMPNQKLYKQRELVELTLDLKDELGNPLQGEFSMAVTDGFQVNKSIHDNSIVSDFLLCSDLKGNVQEPMAYFDQANENAVTNLDLLLLTQGWRRFSWEDLSSKEDKESTYLFEQGLTLKGKVSNANDKPFGKPMDLSIILKDENKADKMLMGQTESNGDFTLYNQYFKGLTEALFQTTMNGKKRTAIVDISDFIFDTYGSKLIPYKLSKDTGLDQYLKNTQADQAIMSSLLDTDQMLDQVVVTASKFDDTKSRVIYNRANATTVQIGGNMAYAGFTNIFQAINGRVAGLTITGNMNDPTVQIRGTSSLSGPNEPLFLVDGTPADKNIVASISVTDVDKVDVLKGPAAAIFGSRGSNGVISILTKRANPNYDYSQDAAAGVNKLLLNGFSIAKEFYKPNYALEENPKPDYRTTLTWEPVIKTDQEGKAKVSFYTSDASTRLLVDLQGLSYSGKPIAKMMEVEVR